MKKGFELCMFLSQVDHVLHLDETIEIMQNGKCVFSHYGPSDLRYCISNCAQYEIAKAGTASLRRLNLSSFHSTGQYGGTHTNPPGITPADDLFVKRILRLTSQKN